MAHRSQITMQQNLTDSRFHGNVDTAGIKQQSAGLMSQSELSSCPHEPTLLTLPAKFKAKKYKLCVLDWFLDQG